MGRGVLSPLQPIGRSGERRKLPQQGPGRTPAENGFGTFSAYDGNKLFGVWRHVPSSLCSGVAERLEEWGRWTYGYQGLH